MATHSSILAWEIPWPEEPGRLQPTGSQRVDVTNTHKHLEFSALFKIAEYLFLLQVFLLQRPPQCCTNLVLLHPLQEFARFIGFSSLYQQVLSSLLSSARLCLWPPSCSLFFPFKTSPRDVPHGPVVKNLPASVGDTSSIPDLGMPWSMPWSS